MAFSGYPPPSPPLPFLLPSLCAEQQRLGFARMFFHQPRFCLSDEATSAMDLHMVMPPFLVIIAILPHASNLRTSHHLCLQHPPPPIPRYKKPQTTLRSNGEWTSA